MEKDSPQYFSRSPEQFGGKIPFIVTDLIEKLREPGVIEMEGIFRVSGLASNIADLCATLDNGRISDWTSLNNPHSMASALKKYFRGNCNMLTAEGKTEEECFKLITKIPDNGSNEETAVEHFRKIMQFFSKPRQYTLGFFFLFLNEVASHKATSKMDERNLAICIAPNLLEIKDLPPDQIMANNATQNNAISAMIRLAPKIFEEYDFESMKLNDEDMKIISYPPINEKDISRYIEVRSIRKKSFIPFVPYELLNDPKFVRPSRQVDFPSE